MEKLKPNKSQTMCVFAIALVVFAQALEKILEVAITPSKDLGIIFAMLYTVITAVVFVIVSRSQSSFTGMLAAIFALKMLPPKITYLAAVDVDATMLYYIVQKMSVVLFAVLIYKMYKMQEEPRQIKPLPVLVLILSVPFFNEISVFFQKYLLFKSGTMLYSFFAEYICYAVAVMLILAVAYGTGGKTLKFVTYFQVTALCINILRTLGKVGYFAVSHQHISKSLYGWIIVYAALIVVFLVSNKMLKSKSEA